MTAFPRLAFPRFLILYATLYASFGVQSPYLPTLLESRNLRPEAIALVLAAGGAVRLAAGPAAGRLADRLDAPRIVLSLCSVAAALIALGYLSARGLWVLCAIGVFHSAALAPLAPLSDTLALGAATGGRSNDTLRRRFEYGWVRGAGSAAFIFGSVLSGQAVGHFGIATVVWLSAALLTTAAFAAILVPQLPPVQDAARPIAAMGGIHGTGALLRLPLYRRVVLIAALIMGSHAMHDSFAVIRWGAAGINPGTSGLLWSLLDRLGPAGAATVAAAAGIVRWAVTAETTWLPALVATEPLHGLTFALLHLTCRVAEAPTPAP